MPIIPIPPEMRITNLDWAAPPTYATNRSELTGKTRTVELGPAERWTASGNLAPVKRTDAAAVRWFLAMLKRPNHFVRLRMTQAPQVSALPTAATVMGAGQLGLSLTMNFLRANDLNLRRGDIISVSFGAEDEQPIVLADDLIANGSGVATAVLTTPLRRSPANGALVEMQWPTATMRMRNPLQWGVVPGPIYSSPVEFEEAF